MKKYITILAITLVFLLPKDLIAQEADKIVGQWYTDKNESIVEIYKVGNKYHGKIIWIENPNNEDGTIKRDKDNPDPKLRNRTIQGLEIMTGLEFDDDEWEDGEIYDPQSGNTYSCYIELENANTLSMRGYMGISILGRTTVWTRKK